MKSLDLTRRATLLGGMAALGGCGALGALNTAATPLPIYDLSARSGASAGRRTDRTLVVARPEAPATLDTDRIMVRPDAVSVAYIPAARWGDDLPEVVQSLLVRSLSGTGRIGYVGRAEGGPVPDRALLTRIDAFEVVDAGESLTARVAMSLTLIADRSQRVIASREFAGQALAGDETPRAVVQAFQAVLDAELPVMADWVASRA